MSGVAHLRKQQANQAKPIDEQIANIKEMEKGKRAKERLLNREGLKMILSVILWLARQGLPLRGHREQDDFPSNNRGNFLELLQFKLEDDPKKKRWFDSLPENSTYVSPPMQNVFIQIIADQVRAAVLQELNDGDPNRVFAICADESIDLAKREQMSLYIRFVNKKGDLVERCLALIEVPSTKAANLLEAIHASMKTSQFDKSRVIAQCYDGTSNMSGEFNGLQQLIREHGSPNAIYVHCYAHRLNLVIVELTKSSTLVSKFFATIQGLVVLIGASAKRLHFFTIAQQDELRRLVIDQDGEEKLEYEVDVENVNDDVESEPIKNEPQRKRCRTGHTLNREKPEQMLKLKQIGETRWSRRIYALMAIMRTYKALKIALVLIDNYAIDAKHVVQAAGLLGQINTFEFILMMHLMIEVLE